ncbi:MAG: type restriction-modification enzyme subunit [Acidimicrobiaceae bacterium]|nr:type restriction-modification enzyme subunit [Acidimicrobiaceae bacterium]
MREGWRGTTLGEVAELSRRRVDPQQWGEYPVTHYSIPALDETGRPVIEDATGIQSQKFLLDRDAVLVSLINPRIPRVWMGRGAERTVCSTEFAVIRPSTDTLLLLDYLYVVCSSPEFYLSLQSLVAGTTGSRQRVKPVELTRLPFLLPPLNEQRRIVDLIAAVDEAIEAATEFGAKSAVLLDTLLDTWIDKWGGQRRALGDLAAMGSGPSWTASDESLEQTPNSVRVIGIANTPPGDSICLSESKYVSGLSASVRRLKPSSLLMIRTNGNRDRIGNVYEVGDEVVGSAFSAFQIGVDFADKSDASFAYWMLAAPQVQTMISESASGTTGLGNVAVRWLRKLKLPWPEDTVRREMTETWAGVRACSSRCRVEVASLTTLRSALLDDILSGEHEIPASYDVLLSA